MVSCSLVQSVGEMRSKLKHWAGNLLLTTVSLCAILAFLETVVFGMFLKPDDLLDNVTINSVVRYVPGSIADFRHPDGRVSRVTVNADGWNSTKQLYDHARTPGRLRIAVIGDSYVHASYVDTEKAFPEIIEKRLKESGIDAEVLRFGMDGAPLSQYFHVLRREVVAYQPDIVLVQLIHNDFDESYRLLKTRYASSFLKVDVDEQGRASEISPADFKPSSADLLRRSATFRYLYYETNLYLTAKSLVSRYFWGGEEDYDPAFIVSAVDTRNLGDVERMGRVTRYIISGMKELADSHGIKLAFAMDGVREKIYGRSDPGVTKVERLNGIAAEAAEIARVPFLDLTRTFADDYAQNQQRFEYPYDWHWNARTNRLVGRTIADWMLADPRLLGRMSPAAETTPVPQGPSRERS